MIVGEGNVRNTAKAACFTVFSDSILLPYLSGPQGSFWRADKIKWVKQSHKPVKSERHVISSKKKKRTISMPRADSNAWASNSAIPFDL